MPKPDLELLKEYLEELESVDEDYEEFLLEVQEQLDLAEHDMLDTVGIMDMEELEACMED